LAGWLLHASERVVAPSVADEDGNVWPSIDFIEPNLGFGVEAYGDSGVSLRVHFSLESAPEWADRERRVASCQFFVHCTVPLTMLRTAAAELSAELKRFPERTPTRG
jgi:hypothetical protein